MPTKISQLWIVVCLTAAIATGVSADDAPKESGQTEQPSVSGTGADASSRSDSQGSGSRSVGTQFEPTEEISEDVSVPFPVDI